jgi:hypothetical protein
VVTSYSKRTAPKTTFWRQHSSGKVLIKTLDGLPHGTAAVVFDSELGEATQTGITTTGSGSSETITEVQYTIK